MLIINAMIARRLATACWSRHRLHPYRAFSVGARCHQEENVVQNAPVARRTRPECTVSIDKLRNTIKADEDEELVVPLFKKALLYAESLAIKDAIGEYTYFEMYLSAKRLATQISNLCGSGASVNVAYICPNNALSPLAQWASWMSGQVAMPLSARYPYQMLKYLVEDSHARLIISTPEYESVAQELATQLDVALLIIDHEFMLKDNFSTDALKRVMLTSRDDRVMISGTLNNDFYAEANALLLYTSGTTANPKGVMLSHRNLDAQVKCLVDAWQFTGGDSLLHVLPLNHVHGCVNALMCPMSVGGRIIMHDSFNSQNVWSAMLGINAPAKERVNIFMAVPTIYSLLIAEYDKIFAQNSRMVEYITNYCSKNVRLMVSGSAPLPTTVFNRWHEITGHRLLERYGMTEIGMALSNPYIEDCDHQRIPGTVGLPLPGVKVRLVNAENEVLIACEGELDSECGTWSNVVVPACDTKKSETQKEEATVQNSVTQVKEENAIDDSSPKEADAKAIVVEIPSPGIATTEVKEEKAIDNSSPKEADAKAIDFEISSPGIAGALEVAGPNVFKAYLNRPEETEKEFTADGYFKTGDVAAYEDGVFKILGRSSVDIIKSGGYKVSSLEIESALLNHYKIKDVAVVGIPDETWGERIAAICALNPNCELTLADLKLFCAPLLPEYKHPTLLNIVDELPRNAMSKVNKKLLIAMFLSDKEKINKDET